MISARAKKLVEALKDWRSLEQAYEVAQIYLDEQEVDAFLKMRSQLEAEGRWIPAGTRTIMTAANPLPAEVYTVPAASPSVPLSEKIAQTRGQNGETE